MIAAAWRAELRRRIEVPPALPRLPLVLASAPEHGHPDALIGSVEPALARALAGDGLPLVDAGDTWRIAWPGGASPDRVLADIAAALRHHGRAGAWRDELLSVVDLGMPDRPGIDRPHADAARPSGVSPVPASKLAIGPWHVSAVASHSGRTVVGAIERAAVRPLGITTHAVHLVAHRPDGRVWVQQRALDKSTDPGLWDTTMGGLIAAGESLEVALERETWEEAGLRPAALRGVGSFGRFTVRRPVAHGYMVEETELVEATVELTALPVNQDGEVAGFACLTRAELAARLLAETFTLEAALALALWLEHRPGPAP